jgi:hypothetical protein
MPGDDLAVGRFHLHLGDGSAIDSFHLHPGDGSVVNRFQVMRVAMSSAVWSRERWLCGQLECPVQVPGRQARRPRLQLGLLTAEKKVFVRDFYIKGTLSHDFSPLVFLSNCSSKLSINMLKNNFNSV